MWPNIALQKGLSKSLVNSQLVSLQPIVYEEENIKESIYKLQYHILCQKASSAFTNGLWSCIARFVVRPASHKTQAACVRERNHWCNKTSQIIGCFLMLLCSQHLCLCIIYKRNGQSILRMAFLFSGCENFITDF